MTNNSLPYSLEHIKHFVYNIHKDNDQISCAYETQEECAIFDWYYLTAAFALSKGYKNYVDIGVAYGLQSDIITNLGLNYYGIEAGEKSLENMYFNPNSKYKIEYSVGKMYPYEICGLEYFNNNIPNNTIAVSHLCLGWNCYFFTEKEKLICFKQLSKDFDSAIIQTQCDNINILNECYTSVQKLSDIISIEKFKHKLYDDDIACTFFCQSELPTR